MSRYLTPEQHRANALAQITSPKIMRLEIAASEAVVEFATARHELLVLTEMASYAAVNAAVATYTEWRERMEGTLADIHMAREEAHREAAYEEAHHADYMRASADEEIGGLAPAHMAELHAEALRIDAQLVERDYMGDECEICERSLADLKARGIQSRDGICLDCWAEHDADMAEDAAGEETPSGSSESIGEPDRVARLSLGAGDIFLPAEREHAIEQNRLSHWAALAIAFCRDCGEPCSPNHHGDMVCTNLRCFLHSAVTA